MDNRKKAAICPPQPNFAALNRGCHLCSAGRPSRWALAHISSFLLRNCCCQIAWWCQKFVHNFRNSQCSAVKILPSNPQCLEIAPKKTLLMKSDAEKEYNTRFLCFSTTTTTRTVLWPFVQDYPDEPVPEETFTHPPSAPFPSLVHSLPHLLLFFTFPFFLFSFVLPTPYLRKTVQISFCQNFVKFPPILIIFGRKMAKRLKLCEVYSFFISTNLHHHTAVLNADVPNWYTMLKVVSIRLLTIASSIQ